MLSFERSLQPVGNVDLSRVIRSLGRSPNIDGEGRWEGYGEGEYLCAMYETINYLKSDLGYEHENVVIHCIGQEEKKKDLSHELTRISMQAYFCHVALRAESNLC